MVLNGHKFKHIHACGHAHLNWKSTAVEKITSICSVTTIIIVEHWPSNQQDISSVKPPLQIRFKFQILRMLNIKIILIFFVL